MDAAQLLIPELSLPRDPILRVFVYGTLKQGHPAHEQLCQGHRAATPAAVRGRVVDRPEGYPALFVPPEDVLAHGGEDLLLDAALPWSYVPVPLSRFPLPRDPWRLVVGQLLEFDDPAARLLLLDDFEEFFPAGESHYCRVLIPVVANRIVLAAWAYASPHGERVARQADAPSPAPSAP